MCGFIACYLNNETIEPNRFEQSLKLIQHRGPDQTSVWISDDRHVALGHVRLSILDLQNGSQPFISPDKMIYAVVNGEFYDYQAIRKELIKKGYSFKTNCDSEILIPLYQEYGVNCLDHLRGEFSFVIWDKRNGSIFCARDRFGIKPVYYSIKNNNLYIASEIKSIINLGIPAIWDNDAVYMSNNGIYQQERTCFKNVYSVRPGHAFIFHPNQSNLRHIKYWDLQYKAPQSLDINEKEYIEEFKNKITDSVNVRLRSDVSYACYLSGGLDSTAVLSLASELSHKTPDAFTISFPGKSIDELELAKKTADYLGANHYFVDVTEKDIVDSLPTSIWYGESLVCNTHGVGLYLLSKLVNQVGHKVVLTGGGADELFFGYEFFREDALKNNLMGYSKNKLDQLLNELRASSIAPGMTASEGTMHSDLSQFENTFNSIPSLLSIYMARASRFSKFYNADFQSYLSGKNPIDMFIKDVELIRQKGLGVLELSSYMFCKSTLPGYILSTIGDRVEMANSIEGRVPFLDHHVAEYAQQLPTQLKIKDGVEKYILREATKHILPPWIYERSKQPFFAPESSGELYDFMGDVFHSDLLKYSPFYCQKSVIKLYKNYYSLDAKNKISTDYILTEIMSTCLLQKAFRLEASQVSKSDALVF
ncbi:asparagine synthase (glutamine-hydrolyzing) [Legionella sp. W05-934-2]|jgi:asparagine synthase (glutamine-hydrolysing)|uniref:asparagine synthase (glutamine-hydrolyzing) n=1 Tax=Legionella sp. W05-934-2 TaxID=1198649 RepID=UPI0034619ABD